MEPNCKSGHESNVVQFLDSKSLLKRRVQGTMVARATEESMMSYMQTELLKERSDLGIRVAQVYFIFDHVQNLHVAYLQADYPGLPLTVKGKCRKSCLVELALWFCDLSTKSKNVPHPMLGIQPRFVEPMEIFS